MTGDVSDSLDDWFDVDPDTGDVVGCEHGKYFDEECHECEMEIQAVSSAARLERDQTAA